MPVVNNNKTKTASGDLLWTQDIYGTDGSNQLLTGQIRCYADADATSGAVPGRFEFWTANSSGTLTEAFSLDSAQAAAFAKGILTSGTSGIGYTTGSGGTITQQTNKSTAVALNTPTGEIVMNNASLASNTAVTFSLTNTAIAVNDVVIVVHKSAGTKGAYTVTPGSSSEGAVITVRNVTGAPLAEAIVLQFAVIKSVVA